MSNDDGEYKACKKGYHISLGDSEPIRDDNLPVCVEDPPPMPDGVTFTRSTLFDHVLSYVGDVAFILFCIIVIVGFFMFVGFGLTYWLSRVQWLP